MLSEPMATIRNTDLVYLEVFNIASSEVSVSDWLTHTPRMMVAQTMNVGQAIIARFPVVGRRCCVHEAGRDRRSSRLPRFLSGAEQTP